MKRFLIAASIIAISCSAQAYDKNNVVIGLGISDAFSDNGKEPMANIEWRGTALQRTSAFGIPNVSPQAGIAMTTESAGMVYGGLLYDWNFAPQWALVPSLSAGLYWDGDGKDMGGAIQFRPAIEVNYVVAPNQRIGANLAYITNLGIYEENPAKTDLTFNYSFAY